MEVCFREVLLGVGGLDRKASSRSQRRGEKVYDILFDQRDDGNLTLFVRGPNREVYVERRMPAASMIPNVGKYEDGFETVCLIGLCTGEFCEGPECEVVGSCKQACKEV